MATTAGTSAACAHDSGHQEERVRLPLPTTQGHTGGLSDLYTRLASQHGDLAETYTRMAEIQLDESTPQRDMKGEMSSSQKPLISAVQIAEILGVDPKTIRRWRVEGKLPNAFEVGGVVRWNRDDIDAWLKEQGA